jgi:tetratricopeptide (TPR) repeat protein
MRSLSRVLLTASVLVLAFATLCPAQEQGGVEQRVLTSEKLARGDYDGFVGDVLAEAAKDPDAPLAEFAVIVASLLDDFLADDLAFLPVYEKLHSSFSKNGFADYIVSIKLIDAYRMLGRDQEARTLIGEMGVLSHWAFIGPFGFTGEAVFDKMYSPEEGVKDFGEALNDRGRDRRWRLWRAADAAKWTSFFEFLRPDEGCAYGLCQFDSPEAQDAVLGVYGNACLKLWLNDAATLDADRLAAFLPNINFVPVKILKGRNRILTKTISGDNGSFRLRLLDRNGFPLKGIVQETELKIQPAAGVGETTVGRDAAKVGALAHYTAKVRDNPDDPFANCVAGMILNWYGCYDDGVWHLGRAVELKPDSDVIRFFAGRGIQDSWLLSESYRKNRTKELMDAIVASNPKFIPAKEWLAVNLQRDRKFEDALRQLRTCFEVNPDFFAGHLLCAQICEGQGWKAEAEAHLRQMERIKPGNWNITHFWANRFEAEGNNPEALAAYRKLAETNSWFRGEILDMLEATGNIEEAVKLCNSLLERDPFSVQELGRLSRLQERLGKYAEALAIVERIIGLVPDEASHYSRLADLLMKSGEREKAVSQFKKALEIDPGLYGTRRYIESLAGTDDDFSRPYDVDVKALIPNSPGRQQYPRAMIVYLLDHAVLKLNEDGSHSEIVHQAYKILDKRGLEQYSNVPIQGEILEARTYKPDGTILEPTLIQGERQLTMTGADVGCVVEYKFRRDVEKSNSLMFTWGPFYFKDPSFDAPFLLSRFVIIAPKNFDLKWIQKNYDQKFETKELGDGNVLYVWEAREMGLVEREPMMPTAEEILPLVKLTQQRSWADVAEIHRDFMLSRVRLTRELRKTAEEQTRGIATGAGKLEALYKYVSETIKEPQGEGVAHRILMEKKGNRLILLKALLDAVGVKSSFAFVRHNTHTAVKPDWNFPDPQVFDSNSSLLLCVDTGDVSPVWVIGQPRLARLGLLDWPMQGGTAIILDDDGTTFRSLPTQPVEDLAQFTQTRGELQDNGSVKAVIKLILAGLSGANVRENLSKMDDKARRTIVERIYNANFPGAVLDTLDMGDLDAVGPPLTITATLTLPRFTENVKGVLRCKTGIPPMNLKQQMTFQVKRTLPIKISEPIVSQESFTLVLPGGMRVSKLPPDLEISGDLGTYCLTFSVVGNEVRMRRVCHIYPQQLPAASYNDLVEFCKQVDKAEQEKIWLSK